MLNCRRIKTVQIVSLYLHLQTRKHVGAKKKAVKKETSMSMAPSKDAYVCSHLRYASAQ